MALKKIQMVREGLRAETVTEDAQPTKRYIRGYPILFNVSTKIGSWLEIIRPGALDGVDLSGLFLWAYHNQEWMLGLEGVNLRHEIDDIGLFIECEVLDTERSDEIFKLVQAKILSGMSYWFGVSEMLDNYDTKVTEIIKFSNIWEVSIVPFPAYKQAICIAYEEQLNNTQRAEPVVNKLLL